MTPLPVLLLAGTAEARALAALVAEDPGLRVTASLAGVTLRPADYPVPVRRGGFGGAGGLAEWIAAHGTGAVIDATHPFAARISANAAAAARAARVPLVRLERPGWTAGPGDDWRRVRDIAAARGALPEGAVAFVALGALGLSALGPVPGVRLVARALEAPPALPEGALLLRGPPGRTAEAEADLMRTHGVTHLVARDSGAGAAAAKLAAARMLGLPVVLIDRPPPPAGVPSVATPEAAHAWLAALRPRDRAAVRPA